MPCAFVLVAAVGVVAEVDLVVVRGSLVVILSADSAAVQLEIGRPVRSLLLME